MATIAPKPSAELTAVPKRVLACILCQKRKLKCDRNFPCAVCRKANVTCVPAALVPRQRRRRFAERDLLDRLRHYEDLLREHDIPFEPMHPQSSGASSKASPSNSHNTVGSPEESLGETQSDRLKSETVDLWHAINSEDQPLKIEDDDGQSDPEFHDHVAFSNQLRSSQVQQAWSQVGETNDHLFGLANTNISLAALHPPIASILRLYQIYSDNVQPLLKVTHTPTLQQRIIEAASDLQNVPTKLEALMFSIYAVATCTLQEEECMSIFGTSRKDLLNGYQFACWQALSNCGVLRSLELDCLTALFLYLVSAKPDRDPASLSCMLGVAVRIAQRMGLHRESSNAKHKPLEAELRRRIWWALTLFDSRICELSVSANSSFDPISDCKVPLNVNDHDFRPEMKAPPEPYERPTDASFAVVRSQFGDLLRNSSFYIQFTVPMFKNIARKPQLGITVPENEEMHAIETALEEKYLRHCDPEIPVHFMTLWHTRCQVAKMLILEHYTHYNKPGMTQTDEQRDLSMTYAIRMLEADTHLMTSPLTRGFVWFMNYYMPALAYFHSIQDLRKRPFQKHADAIWKALDENYQAHHIENSHNQLTTDNPLVKLLDGLVWAAWDARSSAGQQQNNVPLMVSIVRDKMMRRARNADLEQSAAGMSMQEQQVPAVMMSDAGESNMMGALPDVWGQAMMDLSGDPGLDWNGFDWNSMGNGGW